MRLISQNGNVDIPYDKAILLHAQDYVMARVGDKEYLMGEYSSMKKSYKAMEMLRNAYCGKVIFQNVTMGEDVLELMKEWKMQAIISKTDSEPRIEYINNNIFVFPKDEEVEV